VYSPQDDHAASAGGEGAVRVWDTVTGDCRYILTGHSCWVYRIMYSPNGDLIATTGDDSTVQLWDAEGGSCSHILIGHTSRVGRAVFSPHGDLIASSGQDNTVRIWAVKSGQCRAAIRDLSDRVTTLDWIQSSNVRLFIGCQDGSLWLWELVEGDGDLYQTRLCWCTMKSTTALNVKDATIEGVQGLSQVNRQLLRQRGALGEPVSRLREASKRVMNMASVVSKLKLLSDEAIAESSTL